MTKMLLVIFKVQQKVYSFTSYLCEFYGACSRFKVLRPVKVKNRITSQLFLTNSLRKT